MCIIRSLLVLHLPTFKANLNSTTLFWETHLIFLFPPWWNWHTNGFTYTVGLYEDILMYTECVSWHTEVCSNQNCACCSLQPQYYGYPWVCMATTSHPYFNLNKCSYFWVWKQSVFLRMKHSQASVMPTFCTPISESGNEKFPGPFYRNIRKSRLGFRCPDITLNQKAYPASKFLH
jgi:hypothetical protein